MKDSKASLHWSIHGMFFFLSSIFLLDMPPINKNKDVGKKVFSYWNSFKIRWGSIFPFFNTYNNQKPWYIMDLLFRTGLWSVILSQDTLALLPPNSRKIKIKEKLGKGFFFLSGMTRNIPLCVVFLGLLDIYWLLCVNNIIGLQARIATKAAWSAVICWPVSLLQHLLSMYYMPQFSWFYSYIYIYTYYMVSIRLRRLWNTSKRIQNTWPVKS
jgi:hypothetical protein